MCWASAPRRSSLQVEWRSLRNSSLEDGFIACLIYVFTPQEYKEVGSFNLQLITFDREGPIIRVGGRCPVSPCKGALWSVNQKSHLKQEYNKKGHASISFSFKA